MLDNILIVDSDKMQSKAIKQSISSVLRHNVTIAGNNQEAINLVLDPDARISLMLLDMKIDKIKIDQMEAVKSEIKNGINSFSLINFIKSRKPDFPIIVLVEYGKQSQAIEAIEAGADDFLVKPVTIQRLGLSISNLLRTANLCKLAKQMEVQLEINSSAIYSNNTNKNTDRRAIYAENISVVDKDIEIKKLQKLEEDAILLALKVFGGSVRKAAASLGIGRSTLYRKINEMNRGRGKVVHVLRENQTTLPTIVTSEVEHS